MDINHLNDDGRTILQRSPEWANGAELDFSPLAQLKLDETGGTTAFDSEGGHNGTSTNGPAWSPGIRDGGLEYDGIDDAIVVPHDDTLSLTESMSFRPGYAAMLSGLRRLRSRHQQRHRGDVLRLLFRHSR